MPFPRSKRLEERVVKRRDMDHGLEIEGVGGPRWRHPEARPEVSGSRLAVRVGLSHEETSQAVFLAQARNLAQRRRIIGRHLRRAKRVSHGPMERQLPAPGQPLETI